MKMKSNSGAKKRFQLKASGKVKRKQAGMRHLLENKSSKRKRHLGDTELVHSANIKQMKRLLDF